MPIVRDPLDPKLSHWHLLAYLLRWEREKQGLSLAQWGKIIGAARSTVSNVEAGRRKIDERQAKLIDKEFRTGGLFDLLLWYGRNGHDPDWAGSVVAYEAIALVIRIYQGQAIPAPFQTPEYARALIRASSAKDREAALVGRMKRQDTVLGRADAPFIWALLDENVLDEQYGGPDVMRGQLLHLLQRPHVSIRFLPRSTAHSGLDGSFRIISIDSRDIAYAGARRGGRLIEMPGEVAECRMDFEQIGQNAASNDLSRRMIIKRLEEMGVDAVA